MVMFLAGPKWFSGVSSVSKFDWTLLTEPHIRFTVNLYFSPQIDTKGIQHVRSKAVNVTETQKCWSEGTPGGHPAQLHVQSRPLPTLDQVSPNSLTKTWKTPGWRFHSGFLRVTCTSTALCLPIWQDFIHTTIWFEILMATKLSGLNCS